jgi:hypothetical protein
MPAMPKKGDPLSAEQIGLLRAWIDQGAEWPVVRKEAKTHWSFQAPVKPTVPNSRSENSKFKIRNPIDAFILERLRKENLEFSPEADGITLLRRLHFDLTGLPPTPEETDAFVADKILGRLRTKGGGVAEVAALRRTLGAALAGCRAVRGLRWF